MKGVGLLINKKQIKNVETLKLHLDKLISIKIIQVTLSLALMKTKKTHNSTKKYQKSLNAHTTTHNSVMVDFNYE